MLLTSPIAVNGRAIPTRSCSGPAIQRLRFIGLTLVNNATITLTARPDSSFRSSPDSMIVQWRQVAKAAPIFGVGMSMRPARQIVSMGETYDFSTCRRGQACSESEIRGARPAAALLARVPLKGEAIDRFVAVRATAQGGKLHSRRLHPPANSGSAPAQAFTNHANAPMCCRNKRHQAVRQLVNLGGSNTGSTLRASRAAPGWRIAIASARPTLASRCASS